MSAYMHAEKTFNTNNLFPWPNIPLLHLHLKGRAATCEQARRGHRRLGSRVTAGVQASDEAVANRPARARSSQVKPAEDSKQARSAFLAAFRDAFKRKQSARCLKLILAYASSLHRSPDQELPSGGWPSTTDSHEYLSVQPDSSVELLTAAESGGQPAYQLVPLTLQARRHLSSVLKGKHQALMGMLIADGNAAGAVQYLYLLPPDRQLCSCLMKECSAAGDLAGLQMAIQARRALGMKDDAFSFSALVTAAGKAGNVELLTEALRTAQVANACNVAVCNAAIEAFGRVGAAQSALDLFEQQMPNLELQPDIITYNSLLRALGRSKDGNLAAAVLHLYDKLCHSSELTPDKQTFSAIFSAAMQLNITDGSYLLQVLSDTSTYGVPLNSRILFAFLQACWGASFTREQVARVFAEVAAMRAHRQPDHSVFAALLTFAQRHLPEAATDVWTALQGDNLVPNEHIYSALFAACAEARTPDLLATAAAAESHMRKQWLSLKGSSLPIFYKEEGWRIAYNSLLNLHAKTGRAEQAEEVYQAMLLNGPCPNSNSANTTIAAFAVVGDTDAAFQRYREMALRGLRPDSSTFGALLHACAQVGNHVSAARVLELMQGAGFAPTVQAYTSYMDACVKANTVSSLAKAFQVFEQMQANGTQATEVTYGCLLVACERLGDVDRAFALYKQACDQGITPSDACHNILINVCTTTGRLHEALDLVKEMARSHRFMQAATLNSLVRALAPSSAARALRMVSFMTTLRLPTYHATSIALIGACARQHLSAEASDLYWRLRKEGVLVTRSAGSDLIVALCKAEQPRKALCVYHDMMASAFGSPGFLMPSSTASLQTDQQDAWSTSPANVDAPSGDSALSDSTERLSGGKAAPQIFMSDVQPAHEDPSSGSAAAAQQDLISVDIAVRAPAGGNSSSSLLMAPKPRRKVSESDSAAASPPNMFQAADAANETSHGKTHGISASPGRSGSTSAERTSEATQQSRAGTTLPSSQPNCLKPAAMSKRQPTVIPHMAAVGALVGALARANELDQALQLYKQVERDPVGAQVLTMSDRTMWQSLMELCCRKGRTADALQVFDDWKVHVSHALERGSQVNQLPRLSNVTLAFLEACCRADPAFEWRVFDVCAAMRQQSERKQQALLARPRKLSHHFYEAP